MLDQTKIRKINVMLRGAGKFKAMFPLLNKRIRLYFLFYQYTSRIDIMLLLLSTFS